jgi:hypothetical protein
MHEKYVRIIAKVIIILWKKTWWLESGSSPELM